MTFLKALLYSVVVGVIALLVISFLQAWVLSMALVSINEHWFSVPLVGLKEAFLIMVPVNVFLRLLSGVVRGHLTTSD